MAHSTPTAAGPLERLPHEQARTIEAFNRTDDAIVSTAPHRRFELEPHWTALSDRILALEEAATHERAASLTDAVYQLLVLRDAVRDLSGEDGAERRVERLIGSVLACCAASCGRELPPAVVEYYGPVGRGPLALVSEALAAEGGAS